MRWSLRSAAIDFNIDRETLAKRLAAQGIKPGADGKQSTADICKAIYGDLDGERLLLTREQRIKLERENAEQERRLMPSELVEAVWSEPMIEFRQRVMATTLTQEEKEELLEILSDRKIDEYFATAIKNLESSSEASDGAD